MAKVAPQKEGVGLSWPTASPRWDKGQEPGYSSGGIPCCPPRKSKGQNQSWKCHTLQSPALQHYQPVWGSLLLALIGNNISEGKGKPPTSSTRIHTLEIQRPAGTDFFYCFSPMFFIARKHSFLTNMLHLEEKGILLQHWNIQKNPNKFLNLSW